MIPPIWFVELTRINHANAKRRLNTTSEFNTLDVIGETLGININNNNILSTAV